MAACMALCHPKPLGSGEDTSSTANQKLCGGLLWLSLISRGAEGTQSNTAGPHCQVTAGAWTCCSIRFVELSSKLNIFLGESDGSPREMVTAMLGDSPVPSLYFPSHHTIAILTSACVPAGSMSMDKLAMAVWGR